MGTQLDANSTLSHYRIISKLGVGGMGEVYLGVATLNHRAEAAVRIRVKLFE